MLAFYSNIIVKSLTKRKLFGSEQKVMLFEK